MKRPLPIWFGILVVLMLLAGREVVAQGLYRCQAPDGSVSFTENECAPDQKAQMLPPPPAELHPDLTALCGPGARNDQRRSAACGMMLACRKETRRSCVIYCADSYQSSFPELRMGPASPICLKLNAWLKRGSNWVQAGARQRISGGFEFEGFNFYCIDSREAAFPQNEGLYCKRGTSDCARGFPEVGGKTASPDQLASAICREKYGTRFAPQPSRPDAPSGLRR